MAPGAFPLSRQPSVTVAAAVGPALAAAITATVTAAITTPVAAAITAVAAPVAAAITTALVAAFGSPTGRVGFPGSLLLSGFLDQGLAGQAELAGPGIDVDQLDLELVADLGDAFQAVDVAVVPLADMDQAFGAGDEFDEGAELLDAGNRAGVGLADLGQLSEVADPTLGLLDAGQVGAGDGDDAIVVDVELAAGLLLDAPDSLAALADDLADEFRIDLDLDDLGAYWLRMLRVVSMASFILPRMWTRP